MWILDEWSGAEKYAGFMRPGALLHGLIERSHRSDPEPQGERFTFHRSCFSQNISHRRAHTTPDFSFVNVGIIHPARFEVKQHSVRFTFVEI
jgi:hypothetical protein